MRIGIFSLIEWDFIHQRPHKFAEELAARGHTIFYIEPADVSGTRAGRLRRALHLRPPLRAVGPRITALRPMVVPPFRAYAHLLPLNRFLQPLATHLVRQLDLDFAIVLATEYAPVVRALGIPFAYDHVDDTHLMEHVLTEQFVRDMEALRRDGAFTSYIQRTAARRDPEGVFIPNGADLDQFQPLAVDKLFDAVVLSNIAKWFDMDAILSSRHRILLIGPMDVDQGDNRARFLEAARPNLLWIPQIDKQLANQWLSRAEVGLVPFKHTHPVVRYAMPIKILEYFLAGLPVVTYRNEGIADMYGDMVTFYANDGTDQPLDDAIEEAKTRRDRDYRSFAARYQWRDIVGELEAHILRATGRPESPVLSERERRLSDAVRRPPALLPRETAMALASSIRPDPQTMDCQIVYWGLTDWEGLRQRPQHLASELSRRYDVLYVRPLPLSRLVRQRGRRLRPVAEQLNERLTIIRPRILSPGRLPAVARANERRATAVVRQYLDPQRPVVLWLSHPDQASQIGKYGEALVCYDRMDDHPAFTSGAAQQALEDAERSLLRRADLVFASGEDLHKRGLEAGARAFLVPNACEFERFATAAIRPLEIPRELALLPRPRLLFYGMLGWWVDMALVAGIARARPNWSVALVGTVVRADLEQVSGLANVHLLGWQPYESLPAYLQHADACLLPLVDSELTRAVDPVKVYEYLAAGKPVIATPLPELAKCGDLVDIVTTPEQAVEAVEGHLLDPGGEARRRQQLGFAAQHTWQARANAISAQIEASLAARPRASPNCAEPASREQTQAVSANPVG
ncbi:MAG TPA: glycosyltransferase [Chloroflexota bacterium]|nr:glycosyltransferase [Chloroflexota bacterium]